MYQVFLNLERVNAMILVENQDKLERGNCPGCLIFVSGVSVAMLSKFDDFYLSESQSRDRFESRNFCFTKA